MPDPLEIASDHEEGVRQLLNDIEAMRESDPHNDFAYKLSQKAEDVYQSAQYLKESLQ